MRMLVGVLGAWGLLTWSAALAGDRTAGGGAPPTVRRSHPATAPAGNAASPAPGGRKPGGVGPRRPETRPAPAPEERLTPEQVKQVMDLARENFPQIHQRLVRLRKINPPKFQQMLREMQKRLQPLQDMRKRDPELAKSFVAEYQLQLEILELSARYHQSQSDSERAQLRSKIQAKARERFELYQARIKREIERLRTRLDDQEKQLSNREEKKEEMLRREVDRLLRRPPGRVETGTNVQDAGG